jgi:YbbR domain-containing protein
MQAYKDDTGFTEKIYKGIRGNNRLTAFGVCLLIAVICWVLTSLNKTYSGRFTFDIRYSHLPFQKEITSNLPEKITVEMEARGFDLIAYSFRQQISAIDVDVSSLITPANANRKTLVVQSRNILSAEVTGMKPEMSIRHVIPEYITFDFSPKFRKKVAVVPDVEVTYQKQFFAPYSWIVKPDSVEVAGSLEALSHVSRILTEPLRKQQIDRKMIIPVALRKDVPPGVEINPGKVWIYFPVEELAEESIQIPVETISGPEGDLILLPDKVTVTFQAPVNSIDKINTEEFRVCADLSGTEKSSGMEAKLDICHMPAGVYKARIEPGFIKFLSAK